MRRIISVGIHKSVQVNIISNLTLLPEEYKIQLLIVKSKKLYWRIGSVTLHNEYYKRGWFAIDEGKI